MKLYINRSVTLMLMAGTEIANKYAIVQPRYLLRDIENVEWIKVDTYGKNYDIYARLTREVSREIH